MAAPKVSKNVVSDTHKAYFVGAGETVDDIMKPAGLIDHTDEEIALLKKQFTGATGMKVPDEPKRNKATNSDSDY